MPGIELSKLTGPELRRLLKVAQARGDEALAEQLAGEVSARGSGGRRADAPPPPLIEEPDFEEDAGHMTWQVDDEPYARRRASGPSLPLMLGGSAAAGVLAVVLFLGLRGHEAGRTPQPSRPLAPAVASAPGELAAATPPETPRAMVARSAPASPQLEAVPASPPRAEAKAPAPTRQAKADSAPRGKSRRDPCAEPPTPADRTICNDLALAELHHEMREAYVRALNARADPYVVGEGQDVWMQDRNPVTDPQALARLYDRRIRELNAATAAARGEQAPY